MRRVVGFGIAHVAADGVAIIGAQTQVGMQWVSGGTHVASSNKLFRVGEWNPMREFITNIVSGVTPNSVFLRCFILVRFDKDFLPEVEMHES